MPEKINLGGYVKKRVGSKQLTVFKNQSKDFIFFG
jgi:hypothetical protein